MKSWKLEEKELYLKKIKNYANINFYNLYSYCRADI